MGKKIADLLLKPIYVYLIGILYLVYKISFDPFRLNTITILVFITCYLIITFSILFFFEKAFKYKYSSVFISVCWIMFLFHSNIVLMLEAVIPRPYIKYKYVWLSAAAIGLALSYVSYWFRNFNTLLNKVANIFASCAIIVVTCNTIIIFSQTNYGLRSNYSQIQYINTPPLPKKDVVWILMDEYVASSYLQSRFNYINPLDSFLSKRNFYLLKNIHSRANYTVHSLNNIFNLDSKGGNYNFEYSKYSLAHSALPKILNNLGYKFINISFFNIGNKRDVGINNPFGFSILYTLLNGTIAQVILQGYFSETYNAMISPPPFNTNSYNSKVLLTLKNNLSRDYGTPTYIWAHLLIPHQPFYKLYKGNLVFVNPTDTLSLKRAYTDYLSYGNGLLMKLWEDHPELKRKIVIISGDHGVRMSFLGQDDHVLRPFCAVYLPAELDTTGIGNIDYVSQLPKFILRKQKLIK